MKQYIHTSFPFSQHHGNARLESWTRGEQIFSQGQVLPLRGWLSKYTGNIFYWMNERSLCLALGLTDRGSEGLQIRHALLAYDFPSLCGVFCWEYLFFFIWLTLACHWSGINSFLTGFLFFLFHLPAPAWLVEFGSEDQLHSGLSLLLGMSEHLEDADSPQFISLSPASPQVGSPCRYSVNPGGRGRRKEEGKGAIFFSLLTTPFNWGIDSFVKHKS